MPLKVLLAANLRKYVPGYDADTGHALEVLSPVTVRELSERLGIPHEEVKLIMVNGVSGDWDTRLMGDERVALFPPVGGG